MRLFLTVKRVTVQQGNTPTVGAASFAGIQKLGVHLWNLLDARATVLKGLAAVPVLNAVVPVSKALSVVTSATGSGQVTAGPAVQASALYANSAAATDRAGAEIVQVTMSLSGVRTLSGGAAYTFGGRSDWTNPTNINGSPNGAVAGFAGNALGARSGGVRGTFGTFSGKTDLTIDKVEIKFYVQTSNDVDLRLGYESSTGVQTQLEDVAGAVSNLNTPRIYDVTAVVGGVWADIPTKLAAAYATASTAVLNTATASLDAVELVVTASQTTIQ